MNKKGFTLIELLAVIVILAIVTVIGATTVLPYLKDSRKKAFVVEANEVMSAAENAMSLITIGKISDTDYKRTTTMTTPRETYYCFTLEQLVNLGLWTKDEGAVTGDNKTYEGWVMVRSNGNNYSYTIAIENNEYYVNNVTGAITEEIVKSDDKNLCNCNLDQQCLTQVPGDIGGHGKT